MIETKLTRESFHVFQANARNALKQSEQVGSPFVLDWVFGTLATLLAALWTSRLKNRYLAPLPPVICNAVIVGAEIAWFSVQEGEAFLPAFGFNALTVGAGEAVACYVLGTLLLRFLPKVPALRKRMTLRHEAV